MADEEQFSLCWNNFNSNLSAGFHESLCRGDLVDVTLAAEGQLVKAHRLVLSVCSPYFRKMFTQMPANQHAFVFLKDVSHAALKDLIQFMYCGEVNVKQDALPTFISTAEALQIKGLTETGEPATPASSQTPVKVSTPAPSVASTTATTSPRSRVQRNISRTSYKLESEDSSDDKPAPVVAQKRLISRSITPVTAPALKRTKNSDPLEASEPTSQQQIITTIETKSNAEETEFIDLPMETMPTKSEPDYGDDTGEVEAVDQDTTYVEDDSGDYGDMKYDSSYFTENDDVKAGASGFAEPYAETGDQSANEAQGDPRMYGNHGRLDKKPARQFARRRIVAKLEAGVHVATEGPTKRRCQLCSKFKKQSRTKYVCPTCDVALCLKCFDGYHSINRESCDLFTLQTKI
ncbi:modifier of mdg4 isoform X47 [Bradysia coprophila]|uniref:modifier of mdg4 isoform X47 n=1 Tax=Bradysia coprophila TaxID=38358 RepID=UPI00187DCBFB|nr:modifier of mdg4 isoform X47 [Bradysia coprophila]